MKTTNLQSDLDIYPQTWYLESPIVEVVGDSEDSTSLAAAHASWPVEVQPMPRTSMAAGLFWVWLRPRAVLLWAARSGQSWIAPIGLALLAFYLHFFLLASLGASHLSWALLRGVLGILIGWPVYTILLYVISKRIGGYPAYLPMLTMSAWATLPLTLGMTVQSIYMMATGNLIHDPGLSGLLQDPGQGILLPWVTQIGQLVLGRLDLYTLWWLGLLLITVSSGAHLTLRRATFVVGSMAALVLLVDGITLLI